MSIITYYQYSIKPPTNREEALVLCDPQQAKLAVERAGQWQTPFRVALPTYGYWMQFDADGGYRRLSGETTPSLLHPDGSMEPLMADPHAMADLVHHWQQSHPRSMTGLIWFRLPVASDRMNWRWETLASVMQGRPPRGNSPTPSRTRNPVIGKSGQETQVKSHPFLVIALRFIGLRESIWPPMACSAINGKKRLYRMGPCILRLTSTCTLWTREKNISLDGYAFRAPIVWSS